MIPDCRGYYREYQLAEFRSVPSDSVVQGECRERAGKARETCNKHAEKSAGLSCPKIAIQVRE